MDYEKPKKGLKPQKNKKQKKTTTKTKTKTTTKAQICILILIWFQKHLYHRRHVLVKMISLNNVILKKN